MSTAAAAGDGLLSIGEVLQMLKADKRAIFSASAHAQRAADYLHRLQAAKPADERTQESEPRAA